MPVLTDRLATIPELSGRIYGAAKLSELMARNQLSQADQSAFVLPLGFRGGQPSDATGLFVQPIEWLEGVLLVVRAAGDATGGAAVERLRPLIEATLAAVAGWAPDPDSYGVYVPRRGELVGLAAGTLTYQIDFAIDDQLRINP